MSCASTPKEDLAIIQAGNYAGYWYREAFNADDNKHEKESWLKISCQGDIEFKIKENNFFDISPSNDSGKIHWITNKMVQYRSWIGFSWNQPLTAPVQDEKGCWHLNFKEQSFKSIGPYDCSKKINYREVFKSAMNYLAAPHERVVICD